MKLLNSSPTFAEAIYGSCGHNVNDNKNISIIISDKFRKQYMHDELRCIR